MIETSQIWWRQITGARKFLDKPANALANGKSSVICLSKETPWLEDMREILRELLLTLPCVKKIYPSDANFLLVKVSDANAAYLYLQSKGIIVRNRNKVQLCENCLRITVGTPEENAELFEAMKAL